MLAIKDDTGHWKEWHVGDPLPEIEGRVITFQADGDELDVILASLDSRFRFHKYEPDVPRCPKCGSYKLSCPNGHTWEIPTSR